MLADLLDSTRVAATTCQRSKVVHSYTVVLVKYSYGYKFDENEYVGDLRDP